MDIAKVINGIRIDPASTAPMYLQIANSFMTKIQGNLLPAGTKLPPERELAELLSVSRTTIINAYRFLEERGLIATRIGSGTYVAELPAADSQMPVMPWEQLFTPRYKSPLSSLLRNLVAAPTANETISFAAGMPDPLFYPLSMIQEALSGERTSMERADFGYIATDGYLPFKQSLAAWQSRCGIDTSAEKTLIVSGSQQGLYLIIKAFVEPRDYVIVESPTYLGAIQIFESSGARILCLPQSASLDLELLEDYLIRYRPKLFYTIPTFQNPTGRVMSLRDRKELIRLGARYRLTIVEDDPYGQLYYGQQPPPSLKSLDTYGGVIYLGTFSKILFPALRIGWVNAETAVVDRLSEQKQFIDLHSNNLSQKIIHRCITEDYLEGHLKTVRREYKKRRDTTASALRRYCSGHLDFELPEGGFYLWCDVRQSVAPDELLRCAAAEGVTFVPGQAFYVNGAENHQIRLCFATHDDTLLSEGIRRLGRIFASGAARRDDRAKMARKPII